VVPSCVYVEQLATEAGRVKELAGAWVSNPSIDRDAASSAGGRVRVEHGACTVGALSRRWSGGSWWLEWVEQGGLIVATSVLGTRANFPGIVYILHAGLTRSMTDFAQASGQARRGEGEYCRLS
jgi:hypothetical protein